MTRDSLSKPTLPESTSLMDAFVELPSGISTYYLDTCVWGTIAKSSKLKTAFARCFRSADYVAALSHFTLFEISRAPQTFNDLNSLFHEMRHNIWIPCLYDQVVDAELSSYPNT